LLAVRRIAQLNSGRKTAGIDGQVNWTVQERYQSVQRLQQAHEWKHQGLREIPIPKADGTQRILKVPTLQDRAWQTLMAMALEPRAEATFHANSYGFRPGRGCWDAQKVLWLRTRKGTINFSGKV
jgi:retron-type reverse transcriptase